MTEEELALRARELEDRLEELRAAVLEALHAHEEGEPSDIIFASLRARLEHVPAGRWDQAACIAAAHEWAHRYGEPPAALEWNPAGIRARTEGPDRVERRQQMLGRWAAGDWPSLATVQRLFGSWNAFLLEAGWEPRVPGEERRGARSGAGKGLEHLPEWTGWGMVGLYRQRAGVSQTALALKAGISIEYVGYIERGKQTNPSVRVLLALAQALSVPAAVLLDDQDSGGGTRSRASRSPGVSRG